MSTLAPGTDTDSLRHAEAWPLDALAFDPETERFLDAADLGELGRRALKVRRHLLRWRPLSWVVAGMVCEGYNVLSAPPKVGKTRIAHQLLMAVDMGSDWLGRPVRQGPALFVAMEDTLATVTERERALLGYDEERIGQFVLGGRGLTTITDPGGSPGERFARLGEELARQEAAGDPYALVVIDTAARFVGTGDLRLNAYESGLSLYEPLDRLGLRHHVAILGVHHDRKSLGEDEDPISAVSGGLSIAGVAQSVLSIRRTRGGDMGEIRVTPRNAAEHRFPLAFVDGAWEGSRERVEVALQQQGTCREIVRALAGAPKGMPLGALAAYLERHYDVVRRSVQRLRERGQVVLEEGRWHLVELAGEEDQALLTEERGSGAVGVVDVADAPGVAALADGLGEDVGEEDPAGEVEQSEEDRPLQDLGGDGAGADEEPEGADGAQDASVAGEEAVVVVGRGGVHGGEFSRPSWAPVSESRKDWHPITTFTALLEESFRLKRVALIAHPFPRDEDVPEPFRKPGPGKQMIVHEGRHNWRVAAGDVPVEVVEGRLPCVGIDRNGGFLGTLGTAELPIGRLTRYDGRGPANQVGAHLLGSWPLWLSEAFPHPGGWCRVKGPVWVTTPTLSVLEQAHRQFPTWATGAPDVVESLTCRKVKLDRLQKPLRDARLRAIEQGDEEFLAFVKAVYSLGVSTLGETGANRRIWRPDWAAMIRATFHANMWRAAVRARLHGLVVAGLRNTDELWLYGDPFQGCLHDAQNFQKPLTLTCFSEGSGLDQWKVKDIVDWPVK